MGELRGTQSFFIVKVRQFLSRGSTTRKIAFERTSKQHVRISQNTVKDSVLVEKMLMNKQNFKSAKDVDGFVPQASGLYCIRIKNVHLLPEPLVLFFWRGGMTFFILVLPLRICTIGSWIKNFGQRATERFFRSMGAVLGTSPRKDRWLRSAIRKNYKFSKNRWIENNRMDQREFDGKLGRIRRRSR